VNAGRSPSAPATPAGPFRRLDHVGIAVWDADTVIPYYRDTLGLALVGDELDDDPGTRLVYFDAGGSFIQLVQPVAPDAGIRQWLAAHGEGIHHICLAVDDLSSAVAAASDPAAVRTFQAGRRRDACFLNGVQPPSVLIEVTEMLPSR
jgi:methylmalonyl-CoA/ethylmalonyl-CoA epimerase